MNRSKVLPDIGHPSSGAGPSRDWEGVGKSPEIFTLKVRA